MKHEVAVRVLSHLCASTHVFHQLSVSDMLQNGHHIFHGIVVSPEMGYVSKRKKVSSPKRDRMLTPSEFEH
jgi:hypothetical protein